MSEPKNLVLNAETFTRELRFTKSHQYRRMMNPTREMVLSASESTSHHILIEGETSYKNLLEKQGWNLHQTKYQNDGADGWHYINNSYIATSWDELWGWYYYESFYKQIAESIRSKAKIIEIGTYHGRSICHLATMLKDLGKQPEIFAIDYYPKDSFFCTKNENGEKIYRYIHPPGNYLKNIKAFKNMGLGDINIIPNHSEETADFFEDGSIDFLFIDGSYKYEYVIKNLDLYYPKIRLGGMIAGHDYHDKSPGVIKAVDEKFGTNVKIYPGTTWSFIKPFE